jgi:hypothetical protein
MDMSIIGGFGNLISKGAEHPPLGIEILLGKTICTGVFVIRMLLFVVI